MTVRFGLMVTGNTPLELNELEMYMLWRDYSQWDDEGDLILTAHDLPGDRWDIGNVALRPGGACRFGWRDGKPAIKVPKHALAYTLACEILVSRVLRWVGGTGPALRTEEIRLGANLISTIGLADIVMMWLHGGVARSLPGIDTGCAASLARADGYVEVPPTREGIGPGETVSVSLYSAGATPACLLEAMAALPTH